MCLVETHFVGTLSLVYSQEQTVLTAYVRASAGSMCSKNNLKPGCETSSTRKSNLGMGQAGSSGTGLGGGGMRGGGGMAPCSLVVHDI